jgi:hypothetical protein
MTSQSVILPKEFPMIYSSPQGILKLAASNIVFGSYKDDQGKELRGWTAALSMMLGDDRKTFKAFKVYIGKSIQFDTFTIHIQRIESSQFGMIIMAQISPLK